MKKNQNGFHVIETLLLLIIISLIAIVGWYVWKQRETKTAVTDTSQTQSEQPAEYVRSTEAPKDWDTYTSEKYGFSFRYPHTYIIKVFEDEDSYYDPDSDDDFRGEVGDNYEPIYYPGSYQISIKTESDKYAPRVGSISVYDIPQQEMVGIETKQIEAAILDEVQSRADVTELKIDGKRLVRIESVSKLTNKINHTTYFQEINGHTIAAQVDSEEDYIGLVSPKSERERLARESLTLFESIREL